MSYNCCGSRYVLESFLTKEEQMQLLREYHQDLKKEVQGVEEKLKELEVN